MNSSQQVRKSITQIFPGGWQFSQGKKNPITIHDIQGYDQVFRAAWALMAETMVVGGELSRKTKEAIAHQVSENNSCPVCVAAHSMMEGACKDDNEDLATVSETASDNLHEQALLYAALIQKDTVEGTKAREADQIKESFPDLKLKARAEAALVVFLFQYVNRVVDSILGGDAVSVLAGTPIKSEWVKALVKKMMDCVLPGMLRPNLSRDFHPGVTNQLFPENENQLVDLPAHLAWVKEAGVERARAVGRVWKLAETLLDSSSELKKMIPEGLFEMLDSSAASSISGKGVSEKKHTKASNPMAAIRELKRSLELCCGGNLDEANKAVGFIIGAQQFLPQCVFQSTQWETVVATYGEDMARLVIIWWSFRLSCSQAKFA